MRNEPAHNENGACQDAEANSQALISALHRLAVATMHAQNLADFLAQCHDILRGLLPADNFYVALHDPDMTLLSFPYYNDENDAPQASKPFGKGLTEYAIRCGVERIIDREEYFRLVKSGEVVIIGTPPQCWAGTPFASRTGGTVGLMAVQSYKPGMRYTEAQLRILHNVGAQVAVALEHMRAEEALHESEARFRAMFRNASVGMCMVDLEGRIQEINEAGQAMLGYSHDDFLTMTLMDYNHEQDADRTRALFRQLAQGERDSFTMVKRYIRKDGSILWGRQVVNLVRSDDGRPLFAVSMLEDISARKQAEDELLHKAFYDALTDLPNRVLFLERMNEAIENRRRRPESGFAMLLLDLDRFKLVNESMGHDLGDGVLLQLAKRFSEALREGDTLARLGGDEFAFLLTGIDDVGQAVQFVEDMENRLKMPMTISGRELFMDASIGVVLDTGRYDNASDIVRDADIALYRAKDRGGGGYEIFDKPMRQRARHFLQLESGLRRALERDELFVVYQPVVSVLNGIISGFEALVRWRDPERGVIPPMEFIPVAEETGLVTRLDLWVLERACRTIAGFNQKRDVPLTVNVNLSSRDFRNPQLAADIAVALDRADFPPELLKTEITESVLLDAGEDVLKTLAEIREMGARLILDDFGTGYSSLSYLHRFPMDGLKIDKSFVQGMEARNMSYSIIQSILVLGRNLNLDVVAEGVETREQAALLKYIGCRLVQGYLYSPPVEEADAARLAELGRTAS